MKCNSMYCVAEAHDGDEHSDFTGVSFTEPTPTHPVIAHVIHLIPGETK